jgi:hypothetical protein
MTGCQAVLRQTQDLHTLDMHHPLVNSRDLVFRLWSVK